MRGTARPIFVIGSLRSGASLLTWSLGQHPNIRPLLDTTWLGSFAANLEQTYAAAVVRRDISQLDIAGIEIEDFYAYFGQAIDRLLLSGTGVEEVDGGHDPEPGLATPHAAPTERWIDGSPAHCFNVAGLRRLFPEARFIHVLRDATSVVEALTNEGKRAAYRSHWVAYTEEQAYAHWTESVHACVEAERAFGSATVLRVRRDDLITSPQASLIRCLDFVDEPFAPACLRPFR
ncbi:MAG: sulfotransferase [Chloroflexota bacterium]|nr:sulfotransferase [Chloroflexota bacterium]